MKKIIPLVTTLSVIIVVLLHSCKKVSRDVAVNEPPVANAGTNQILILPKDSVQLNGTNSYDPEKEMMTYQWSKIAGPQSYIIRNASSASTVVAKLVAGVYRFELKVTDKQAAVDRDTVQITVMAGDGNNYPPVADAGPDQTITLPLNSCILNGTGSYDPDGTVATYQWTKIGGPASFTLTNSNAATARVANMSEGNYAFELKVTDNSGLTGKDTVNILVYLAGHDTCDVTNRQHVNASLNPIGTLSVSRMPYVAAAGGKIAFAGGQYYTGPYYTTSSAVDIYDVNSKAWSSSHLSKEREGIAAISCGNKIFFAGGGMFDGGVTNIDIYDASTNAWTTADLSVGRSYLTAATVGNKVFFAGGFTEGWTPSSIVDIYDLSTNTWSRAKLSQSRYNLGAVTVGNQVYFAGGVGSTRVDIYNNTTNSWSSSELKELSGPVSGIAVGDKIYWAGIARGENKGEVEIWNTATGEVTFNCLSYPRYAPSAIIKNNEIAFFSNATEWNDDEHLANNLSPLFDIYNVSTNQWSVGVLPETAMAQGFVCLNNTIYVGGGRPGMHSTTDKVYILNW
ncbi:MAG: PKD domain-containing protein [Ginsengibacter sp.]